ncbi:phosphonate ABC transporter ATP-binding protein [Oceanobacillus rekensis]|uniref:phosphonate ABC transporter ATP-binding protein n=1 Tax=Oceanobacillus rekensis TaxID=937927 RepID=UPI000B434866|nr:phosphonate ABC transporter ATP-binding protein [Oceanobacillus rekensis]
MISLEVKNLTKVYPGATKALDDVSFQVNPGEGVVLLGHNGSGKSTLFRCITGFEKPTSGSIVIDDTDITKLSRNKLRPIRKKVGMVFQNFNLTYNLSVFQNVLFGALGHSKTAFHTFAPFASQQLREKAMACLERVGLAHLADRRADRLSGGQQQRVAIARMLMQDPEIVLADEPIASLDPVAGREVMDLLLEIVRERGLAVICILHQMDIVLEYGERIIALNAGEMVVNESIEKLDRTFLDSLYAKEESTEKERKVE